jgi:hypothetical protein
MVTFLMGLIMGAYFTWAILTRDIDPRDKADGVDVICYGCGRKYWISYENFRTSNYCTQCK